MREWSFQRKLIGGVMLICLLAIMTSAGSLFTSRLLISNMSRVAAGEGQDLAGARTLQLAGLQEIADVHASLLPGGAAFLPAAAAGSRRVREGAERLRESVTHASGRALLDSVLAAERAHQEAFATALGASGPRSSRSADLNSAVVLQRGTRLEQVLEALVRDLAANRSRSLEAARKGVQRSESLLGVITTGTVVLLILLCLLLTAALNRSYREQTAARGVAERKQAETRASLSEVETASHLKDEFLATVSHELRNPLAPILTWTQLLRSGTLDEEKSRRALEVIERNVTSQVQLIDDLVDVSRVVSGKFRLDVRPIDLVPVIRAAADAQMPASDAKHIRLQLVLDERAGTISGDSERIHQVMANLISNAIKFTPKGGRVQVVLQRAESHVEIVVSDSGVGIESAFLPHVFEPFRQATGGSMRRHGGLGLGLSIVHHIVELHGGEIVVTSDGPNLGAKFTVQFPLLATARDVVALPRRHPIAGGPLAEVHLGRLDDVRVLVVDDESSASEALVALFESCGAQVRSAGSAPEAFALFGAWVPDVLVSDIAMPGEDGYSLIRRIRQLPSAREKSVPAVALTAYAKIEDRVTILAAGFQMYLSKPADPNELVAVVGSLARRSTTS